MTALSDYQNHSEISIGDLVLELGMCENNVFRDYVFCEGFFLCEYIVVTKMWEE